MAADSEHKSLHLLRRWHTGDAQALEQLIQRNLQWIGAFVRGRLGGHLRKEAETLDFVQEAMVDVLSYGPRFELENEGQFRALLARIVENNIRDKHKWLHRRRRDIGREKRGMSDTVLRLDPPVRSVTSPSQRVLRDERETWVRLAMELLEAEDREVLWLREWEGLSFGETGERMGLSQDAARMRHRRALPRLARRVKELREGRIAALLEASATS